MPKVITGFLETISFYDSPKDNALTALMIFIPVEERIYAEAIASSHRRRFEDSGMSRVNSQIHRAEITITESITSA